MWNVETRTRRAVLFLFVLRSSYKMCAGTCLQEEKNDGDQNGSMADRAQGKLKRVVSEQSHDKPTNLNPFVISEGPITKSQAKNLNGPLIGLIEDIKAQSCNLVQTQLGSQIGSSIYKPKIKQVVMDHWVKVCVRDSRNDLWKLLGVLDEPEISRPQVLCQLNKWIMLTVVKLLTSVLIISLFTMRRKHFPGIYFNIQMDIVIDGCGPVLRLRFTIIESFPWVSVKIEDDGGWTHPAEESDEESDFPVNHEMCYGDFQLTNIRQPSPPPVLAQVCDPSCGMPRLAQDGSHFSNSYHDLHISVKMMEDFLRLAHENTAMDLETCGVLAGSLRNKVFQVTTLIIPKQESTSYSCQTLNEEEIFEVQDNQSLFPLGWIHTHPTQTCFMSSVDLHTHYSYQVMLCEAIAIVMAPTDKSSPHGIFRLSDPAGIGVIRNCEQRGFHPHYGPEDGSPIYERCSHVYMDPKLKCDVIDLR